jgi:hypothetical protein
MMNPETIADRYLAVWNAADAKARHTLLVDGWSENARYSDPLMQGEGREGIAAMIEAARTQFPGYLFTLSGKPDGHGAFVRFSWALKADGGTPVAHGTDVVRLDQDSKISDVIGFLNTDVVNA